MGSSQSDDGTEESSPQHEVTISQNYYMAAFEVTLLQYDLVKQKNLSHYQGEIQPPRPPGRFLDLQKIDTATQPVDMVSWNDAVKFCKLLSELPEEKKAGRVYRLPTEAEWEYACRAGSKGIYHFGDNPNLLEEYDWFEKNSNDQAHPVGLKKPNAWGLYDMHGNLSEICSDRFGKYMNRPETDPVGPIQGDERIVRGGDFYRKAGACRSTTRGQIGTGIFYDGIGFRVVMTCSEIPEK